MSDFGDLVNIEEFGEKRDNFDPERGDVAFYCKNCAGLVETERKDSQGYIFLCKKCGGKNIAVGTQKGLKENYKLK